MKMKVSLFVWLLVILTVVADDSYEDDSDEVYVVHDVSSHSVPSFHAVPADFSGVQKNLSPGPLSVALSSHSVHPNVVGISQQFPQQQVDPANFAYNSLIRDGIGYTQQPVSNGIYQDQYRNNVFQQPLTGYRVQTSAGGARLVPDETFSNVGNSFGTQSQQQGFSGTFSGAHPLNVPYPAQTYTPQHQVQQYSNFVQQPNVGLRFTQTAVPYPHLTGQVQTFSGGISSSPQFLLGTNRIAQPIYPLVASNQFPAGHSYHASGVSNQVGQTFDSSLGYQGQQPFSQTSQTSQFTNQLNQLPSNRFNSQSSVNQFSGQLPSSQFETFSTSNQFGGQSPSNQFGIQSSSNQFGVQSPSNQFGVQSSSNQFGAQFPSNQFSNHASVNQFGNQNPSTQLTSQTSANQFGSPSFVSSGQPFGEAPFGSSASSLSASSSQSGPYDSQSSLTPAF